MLGFEGEQLELYLSKFEVLRRNIDFHEVEGSFKLPSRAWNSYMEGWRQIHARGREEEESIA